jgi:hypothetical protein
LEIGKKVDGVWCNYKITKGYACKKEEGYPENNPAGT